MKCTKNGDTVKGKEHENEDDEEDEDDDDDTNGHYIIFIYYARHQPVWIFFSSSPTFPPSFSLRVDFNF